MAEAPRLERDARKLAAEVGFVGAGFYKLAMSINPAHRKAKIARHVVTVRGKQFSTRPVFVFRKPAVGARLRSGAFVARVPWKQF